MGNWLGSHFWLLSRAALNSVALVLQCGRVSTFLLCTFLRRNFWTHTFSRQLSTPIDAAGQFPFSNMVVSMCIAHLHHEFWLLHSLTRNATFDSSILHPKPISFFFPNYLICGLSPSALFCGRHRELAQSLPRIRTSVVSLQVSLIISPCGPQKHSHSWSPYFRAYLVIDTLQTSPMTKQSPSFL